MKFQATVGKQASANKGISAVSGLSSFPPRSLSSGPDSGARAATGGAGHPPAGSELSPRACPRPTLQAPQQTSRKLRARTTWAFHAAAAVKAEMGCLSQDARGGMASARARAREPGSSSGWTEGLGA